MGLFAPKKKLPQPADSSEPVSAQQQSAAPASAADRSSTVVSGQKLPAAGNTLAEPQAAQGTDQEQSLLKEQSIQKEQASASAAAAAQTPGQAAEESARPDTAKKPGLLQRLFPGTDWGMVRIRLVFIGFLLVFVGLWCRAWYLQMIVGPKLAEYARRQHITTELVTGRRGMIMDRDGQVLARSVEALSVYANPRDVQDPLTVANTLGPIIGVAPQKVYDQLKNTKRSFLWLKRRVDDYTAAAVRKAALPGIGLSKEYERVYPFKHMCGQLLGFVGFEDKGLEGLELALNDRLSSEPKREIVQRDAMGRRFYLRKEGEEDPHGEDVHLTIDVQMQFFAEEAIARAVKEQKARWGGAMVVHVPTGEILAWAQYPFFNPNVYRESRAAIYRNRLAQDALEPGSTFKPLVLAAAMQERQVSRSTLINCEGGRWQTKYTVLRDTSHREILPVHKVLRYSSNIGMAKIGLMMTSQTFYRYLRDLGFGERARVPVVNRSGILRKPKDWSEVDHMSISFGQGISVTPLQMAQAYLALLSNGISRNLVLVRDMPMDEPRKQVFSESVCREVRNMMREVVEAKDGTGRRAAIDGISVGGKTGTAQKADARSGSYGNKRTASFVGFMPVDKPEYLILVFIDEPQASQYGGLIAAPVFKDIAERSLAYAGILGTPAKGSATATVLADGTRVQGRGFRRSEPDAPFVRTKKTAPAELADMNRKPLTAQESMRLPGHLARASSTVPDVTGKTLRNAVELFARAGIVPELKGNGMRVVRQSPPPGSPWPDKDAKDADRTQYILWLSER